MRLMLEFRLGYCRPSNDLGIFQGYATSFNRNKELMKIEAVN